MNNKFNLFICGTNSPANTKQQVSASNTSSGAEGLGVQEGTQRKTFSSSSLTILMIILALLERGTGRCDHVIEFWGENKSKKRLTRHCLPAL